MAEPIDVHNIFQPQANIPKITIKQTQTVEIPIVSSPLEAINKAVITMLSASGLTPNQAKTVIYYSTATYLEVDIQPILCLFGPAGTGKTSTMEQQQPYLCRAKQVTGKTKSALREGLSNTRTALIEEGDRADEELIGCRYSKRTANISVMKEGTLGWRNQEHNIFGATIIHKRKPFEDAAVRSRAIIIKTRKRSGNYQIKPVSDEEVKAIADIAEKVDLTLDLTSERVADTWRPLILVAKAVGDYDWIEYAKGEMELDEKALLAGQGYEPEQAMLLTLQNLMITDSGVPMDVQIKDVKRELQDNFDVRLKIYQIDQMASNLGFTVTKPSGYPVIKANKELLNKLLKDVEE